MGIFTITLTLIRNKTLISLKMEIIYTNLLLMTEKNVFKKSQKL